jgi:hypothetical protein
MLSIVLLRYFPVDIGEKSSSTTLPFDRIRLAVMGIGLGMIPC